MPPKRNRIHTQEFKGIGKGHVITTPFFDLKVVQGEGLHIACIVKTKLADNAVKRNKIRRKMYHALTKALQGRHGFYIAYPKKQTLYTPFAILSEALINSI